MIKTLCLSALFLFNGVSGPAAQDGGPAYRVTHYDLRIEPDFATKTVRIEAAIEIDNPSLAGAFNFNLADVYKIVSLSASGSPARATREDGQLTCEPDRPRKRESLRLEIEAAPGNSPDEKRPVLDDQSLFLLWSDRWYPADFNAWAPVRTTVVLPPAFEVIAPGREVSAKKRGGKIEHVYETTRPTVSFSVFADARWVRAERVVDGFRIVTLLHPESRKHLDRIFSTSPDVLKFFTDLHGSYPFDQFGFVTIPGMYARRAFPGWVGYSPEYLDKEMERTGYDAHETSLLWWGLTSHGSGPGSWQWTEGLGDYVEVMYGEARRKPLPQNFVRFRNDYLATPVAEDVTYDKLRGNTPQKIVHGKYPWTMQVLRERIGDDAFRRGIRLLFERAGFRTFTMDEFVATFEQASGLPLRWWREQWLERKGVPVVALASTVVPGDKGFRVTCRLEQEGKLYDLPLEIGIRTANGLRIEKILLREKAAEAVFDSAERPLDIVLDPNERVLMKRIRK